MIVSLNFMDSMSASSPVKLEEVSWELINPWKKIQNWLMGTHQTYALKSTGTHPFRFFTGVLDQCYRA